MKKLYLLSTILSMGFVGIAFGQYTATNSGNWNDPITWAPGAIPSSTCNNCTITINDGVVVTLNTSQILTGSTQMIIGNSISGTSQVIIPFSGGTTFSNSYNLMLDAYSQAKVILPGNGDIIQVTTTSFNPPAAGEYDGVFSFGPLPSLPGHIGQQKIVGNAPSYFIDGNPEPFNFRSLPSFSGVGSIGSNGTLPLLLNGFNASYSNAAVNLNWSSSNEINFSHFTVQRSADASNWETIGTVAAMGNSTLSYDYSFRDASPLPGVNFYRLMMVDNNGRYLYSLVRTATGSISNGLRISPNPAKNFVNVTLGYNMNNVTGMRLVSVSGQLLQQKQLSNAAGTTVSFDVNNYPEGIYMVQVKNADGSQQVYKVFVSR